MLDDIRNKILLTTYNQMLKLLSPTSMQFTETFPNADMNNLSTYPLSENELIVITDPVLQHVQMGAQSLSNLDKLDVLPMVFIMDGSDDEVNPDKRADDLIGEVNETMPMQLVLVIKQKNVPTYEQTNPVVAAKIRSQLDFILDTIYFEHLMEQRHGYNNPSRAWRALITRSDSTEGSRTPYEIIVYRFEVQFKRQAQRSAV